MSSEGTMSVVGSEVIPLDYGSMDSESSPSSTSSERTVEERRDERVVEEEENEIPSNILEAGSKVDGCYDPDLEIVSEVGICERTRACSAPRDHWMPIYVHYLIAGLRFPIPELLVGLLLDYSIRITQLTPNAIRAGGRGKRGGTTSTLGRPIKGIGVYSPSSIKGWKEKFFFVDDTEWSRGDAEVEQLSAWKAKKTKQNNYKLNEDEVEEVKKLVREEGDVVDIMYLTSLGAIEVAELYGPSSLSEAKMDSFINAAGGLAIPKKPRKKSKTSTVAEKEGADRERLSSNSARALEMQPRPKPVMGGSEEVSEEEREEVAPLHRKKRKVAETEVRRDEVVKFVPWPSPPEIDPELKEREEAVVRGPSKGKELIPPPSYQKSLFEAMNTTGAKRFLNAMLPEVDRRQARQEAVSHLGARVVRHTLEEYAESVRDCANWQRQCEALLKEKEELQKEKEELQKRNNDMQRRLDEVLPSKLEAQDKYIENMKKGVTELKKNVNLLVHNGMEEHIGHFLNSSVFENIINLYQLPTVIVAFTNCRKKVKAQYPEVDVTTVTFGEQEERVEEDGESLFADFRPLIKLRWEHDVEGRTIFPPTFDVGLVAVEEEEEEEAEGAGVENEVDLAGAQPPVVHPVSSDEVQQLAPPEAEVPPLPSGDEPPPPPPPLPAEEQPPPSAD
ncbi:hypothetical protein SLEP1_g26058 [Rubroshorea leprosula]|uniref:Uncharacterized protein n=1 Tax=Rubroshorea leprosula TaxID=152421 RepID=A0AAV5JV93_9ROSI|nr:hypothetical protein SLEP1_g26058 [Rubroshorea leprosula]